MNCLGRRCERAVRSQNTIKNTGLSEIIISHIQAAQPNGGHLSASPISINIGSTIGVISLVMRPKGIRATLAVEGKHTIDVGKQIGLVANF